MNNNNTIKMNIDLCRIFSSKRDTETIYMYTVCSYLMAGLGYYSKKEFIELFCNFTSYTRRTFYRKLPLLVNSGMIQEKRGVLYITGKKQLLKDFQIDSNRSIKFTEESLRSKTNFKRFFVTQCAVLLQKRFRYSFSKMKDNTESLYSKGVIESPYAFPSNRRDVGVALSKIAEFTGYCKSDVAVQMKGVTRKVYKRGIDLTTEEATQMKRSGYFRTYYKQSLGTCKRTNKFFIRHHLSSVVELPSYLAKK